MDWLKNNARLLIVIGTVIGSALGTWLGVKISVTGDPNATKPEIHIILPESDGGDSVKPVQGVSAVAREKTAVNKLLTLRARRLAIDQLVKAHGLTRDEAAKRVNAIPESAIAQAAIESGIPQAIYGQFGDGTFLKNLLDWLSDPANQAKIQAMIEFIIRMALLFADAGQPGQHVAALRSWTADNAYLDPFAMMAAAPRTA